MKKLSLRATINKKLKKAGVINICSYGLRWTSGEERLQINDVCHFRAKYVSEYDRHKKGEICELSTTLLPALNYTTDKAAIRKWVSYILLRSPFKDCFKTKNLQAAWRYGIQMDVDKPQSNVVAALIALREGWEFPHILENFTFLTKNGVDESVAFIISRMVNKHENRYFKRYWGGHQTLNVLDVKGMRSLIKKGMVPYDDPLKVAKTHYKIFISTKSDMTTGGDSLESILFENPSGKVKNAWGEGPSYLSEEQFLVAAKEVEKELLA